MSMKRRKKRQKRFPKKPRTGYTLEEKLAYAKKLKKRMTPSEQKIWTVLKREMTSWEFEFSPQEVVCGYIPDFYCLEVSLVVEIDGPIHRFMRERDARRQRHLEDAGNTVVRYTNREATFRTVEVVQEILSTAIDLRLRLPD